MLATADEDLGEIRLASGPAYGGRVLDTSGAPLAGIVAELRTVAGTPCGASPPSDVDGAYRIDLDLPPALSRRPDGTLLNYRLHLRSETHAGRPHPAHLVGLAMQHDVQFVPTQPSVVVVAVNDSSQPSPGTRLELGPARLRPGTAVPWPPFARGTTDSEGRFAFEASPGARSLLVRVAGGAGSPDLVTTATFDLQPGTAAEHIVYLGDERTMTVEGAFHWAVTNEPVEHCDVWVQGEIRDEHASRDAPGAPPPFLASQGAPVVLVGRTDADGTFVARASIGTAAVARFVPKNWFVAFEHNGVPQVDGGEYAASDNPFDGRLPPVAVGTASRAQGSGMWVRIREATSGALVRPLEGRLVFLRSGEEIGRSELSFSPVLSSSGSEEMVVWRVWPSTGLIEDQEIVGGMFDEHELHIRVQGRAPRRVAISRDDLRAGWSGDRVVDLSVPPMSSGAMVHVLSPEGDPAASVQVCAVPLDEQHPLQHRAVTNSQGQVELADLDPESNYRVVAFEPLTGAAAMQSEWRREDLVLRLAAPRPLRVRVLLPDGAVPAPAMLSLLAPASGLERGGNLVADADGWIQIPATTHEIYTFRVWARDTDLADRLALPNGMYTHGAIRAGGDVSDGDTIVVEPTR